MQRMIHCTVDQPYQSILKELVSLGVYRSERAALDDAVRKLGENYGIFSQGIYVDGVLVEPQLTG